MKYYYACIARPPIQIGAVPTGYTLEQRGKYDVAPLRTDLPLGEFPYGLISYPEPIDDPRAYGLEPI